MEWPIKRWIVALATSIITGIVIGVSTAVIPNPIFNREIAATGWSLPVLVATSFFTGMLVATYVRTDSANQESFNLKIGSTGAFLTWFAVGCPVCNKLALMAFGYTGAIAYFAPIQPYLGVAGVALLFYSFRTRMINESKCRIPKVKIN